MRAISFDFYNTLCQFTPPREERQAQAAAAHGIALSAERLRTAYVEGEHFWTWENARWPIAQRAGDDLEAFYAAYEQHLLAAAGVQVGRDLALRIYRTYSELPRALTLFDDALPALRAARAFGAGVAIISNADRNLAAECEALGLAPYVDALVCSCDVGCEKPAPEIFNNALAQLGVPPADALHVGDQYYSDVVGARGVGMHAVLLDRLGLLGSFGDCVRVSNLLQVLTLPSVVDGRGR